MKTVVKDKERFDDGEFLRTIGIEAIEEKELLRLNRILGQHKQPKQRWFRWRKVYSIITLTLIVGGITLLPSDNRISQRESMAKTKTKAIAIDPRPQQKEKEVNQTKTGLSPTIVNQSQSPSPYRPSPQPKNTSSTSNKNSNSSSRTRSTPLTPTITKPPALTLVPSLPKAPSPQIKIPPPTPDISPKKPINPVREPVGSGPGTRSEKISDSQHQRGEDLDPVLNDGAGERTGEENPPEYEF